MQLSDRISRLVLVCSGIGLFGYILKVIIQSINSSFSTIYLGSFPFGVGQVLSIILFTNALIILSVGIYYCFCELHNYGHYEESTTKEAYIKKADKYYLLLLKVSLTSVYMTFLLIFILFAVIPILIAFKITSCIFLGILLILLIIHSIKKWKKNWLKELYHQIKKIKKFNIHLVILFFWICFIPPLTLLGVNQNLNTKFEVSFLADSTPQIHFVFSDHAPDKMPNEIYIKILTSSGKEQSMVINEEDFNKSFIEVKETEQTNSLLSKYLEKSNMFVVNKSSYTFNKSVDLTQINAKDEGYIEIKFDDKSGINNESTYRIVNNFFIKNDKLSFNKEKFEVDL
ncbi:hypothetical protein [Bacillus canaveralius]|uniref:hypothetical protein n=1 Tax=Bacillus canaveralius TaxID=1403243 RepID=UPI000F77EC9A|nr:hypothetical protein [Bacillus canaveralius]RSK49689.1 hypothetical protein EJA13_15555 [Bacillus canaveralius]